MKMNKIERKKQDQEKLDFINAVKKLSPKHQFIVSGVIKDLLILAEVPEDYHPFLLKERIGNNITKGFLCI